MDIKIMQRKLIVCLAAGAVFLSACSQNLKHAHEPQPNVPAHFKYADTTSVHNIDRQWWRVYQDETLNSLVDACLKNQPYTQIGVMREVAARAKAKGANADFLPYLGGNAGFSKMRTSATTPLGDVLSGGTIEGNKYAAGFDTAWQFDVWRRIAHTVEAADAEVGMAHAFAGQIEMVLSTEVAVAYWQFRAAESQLDILNSIRESRLEAKKLLQAQVDAGLLNEQKLSLAQKEIFNIETQIAQARKKRDFAENEIATLVVVPLAEFSIGKTRDYQFPALPAITPGLPADILARRADLVESSYALRNLLAQKQVAQTALYPSIGLTGNFGFASKELKNLVNGDSGQFTLGPLGFNVPIFDGGKIKANIAAADARLQEHINLHQSRVLIALREVDDALTEVQSLNEQIQLQTQALQSARENTQLADARFNQGLSDYLAVTQAQRKTLNVQHKLVELRSEGLFASIRLVAALGGGWSEQSNQN